MKEILNTLTNSDFINKCTNYIYIYIYIPIQKQLIAVKKVRVQVKQS